MKVTQKMIGLSRQPAHEREKLEKNDRGKKRMGDGMTHTRDLILEVLRGKEGIISQD